MSDNQKYYYLKLVDNFFDRDEMIMLESMPDGYMYSNILLKLYLRSLKNIGKLMFNDRIPYNPTMLANITRHPVAVVEKAVQIFEQLGLVEILDNGAIYMLDIQDFIGKSSTEADRKRKYRRRIEEEKQQLLEDKGQMSEQMSRQKTGQMSDKTPPELELELEKELEIELQLDNRDNVKSVDSVDKLAVVSNKIKSYFPNLTDNEVNNVIDNFVSSNRDITYLEEKLVLTKNTNVRSVAGFLIKAIREDYKPNKSNVSGSGVKTKYHNTFNEHYKNYSEQELEEKLLQVQNNRKGAY